MKFLIVKGNLKKADYDITKQNGLLFFYDQKWHAYHENSTVDVKEEKYINQLENLVKGNKQRVEVQNDAVLIEFARQNLGISNLPVKHNSTSPVKKPQARKNHPESPLKSPINLGAVFRVLKTENYIDFFKAKKNKDDLIRDIRRYLAFAAIESGQWNLAKLIISKECFIGDPLFFSQKKEATTARSQWLMVRQLIMRELYQTIIKEIIKKQSAILYQESGEFSSTNSLNDKQEICRTVNRMLKQTIRNIGKIIDSVASSAIERGLISKLDKDTQLSKPKIKQGYKKLLRKNKLLKKNELSHQLTITPTNFKDIYEKLNALRIQMTRDVAETAKKKEVLSPKIEKTKKIITTACKKYYTDWKLEALLKPDFSFSAGEKLFIFSDPIMSIHELHPKTKISFLQHTIQHAPFLRQTAPWLDPLNEDVPISTETDHDLTYEIIHSTSTSSSSGSNSSFDSNISVANQVVKSNKPRRFSRKNKQSLSNYNEDQSDVKAFFESLLDSGDIDFSSSELKKILFQKEDTILISIFVKHGLKLTQEDITTFRDKENGNTLLHLAFSQNNLNFASYLLANYKINYKENEAAYKMISDTFDYDTIGNLFTNQKEENKENRRLLKECRRFLINLAKLLENQVNDNANYYIVTGIDPESASELYEQAERESAIYFLPGNDKDSSWTIVGRGIDSKQIASKKITAKSDLKTLNSIKGKEIKSFEDRKIIGNLGKIYGFESGVTKSNYNSLNEVSYFQGDGVMTITNALNIIAGQAEQFVIEKRIKSNPINFSKLVERANSLDIILVYIVLSNLAKDDNRLYKAVSEIVDDRRSNSPIKYFCKIERALKLMQPFVMEDGENRYAYGDVPSVTINELAAENKKLQEQLEKVGKEKNKYEKEVKKKDEEIKTYAEQYAELKKKIEELEKEKGTNPNEKRKSYNFFGSTRSQTEKKEEEPKQNGNMYT